MLVQVAKGFTLIEVVMTMSVLGILLGVAGISLSSLQSSIATSASDREILYIISSAERKARDGAEGSSWGVYIPYDPTSRSATSATVFSGASYATRNEVKDVLYPISKDILFSYVDLSGAGAATGNDHEIVFSALTGATANYGSMDLQWYNVTRTITIDPDGFAVRQ